VIDLTFCGNPGFNVGDRTGGWVARFIERTADAPEYLADIGPSRVT
jgi:hypothetical protein